MIYFDYAASTPVDDSVLSLYEKYSKENFANPSSNHKLGYDIFTLVNKARTQIINAFNLSNSHHLIFTSSASESNNLAIKGYLLAHLKHKGNVIVPNNEHPSVINTFKQLEKLFGFEIRYINPNNKGEITLDEIKNFIDENTIFVSIMAVNNETGSINKIEEISSFLKKYPKIIFHCDATQAIGKIAINYKDVDLITFSSHKIYGIKGIGGLFIRNNLNLEPLISGGGQEENYRSSTLAAPAIISFARAIRLIFDDFNKNKESVILINNKIREYLLSRPDLYSINSSLENPYILNFSTLTKKASVIQEALSNKGIMVSSVSACSSKKEPFSYVLKSMGKSEIEYKNSIRLSFGKFNTVEEADIFIKEIDMIVGSLK